MKILLILITFLSTAVAAVGATERIRVSLNISASDEIKAETKSSLSRELRKFDDIDIVANDVELQINVVALQLATERRVPGYVLSVVVTAPFSDVGSNRSLKYAVLMCAHFVQVGPDLPRLSKDVATQLDADAFETVRKNHKMFREVTPAPTP